jgi:CRP-like cAMP-binding protein
MIGNVANLIGNLEGDSSEFLKRSDAVNQYMHSNRISPRLQERVSHFMNRLWALHDGSTNEEDFIKELPSTLQDKILEKTRLIHLKLCPYFDFLSVDILKGLARRMTPVVYSAGDMIIYGGDMGMEMYFLNSGVVDVVSAKDNKTVFATLTEGAFFGETSIFFKTERGGHIRAMTFCQVFELRKKDLDDEVANQDFDVRHMLRTFERIRGSNDRRNKAVIKNLKESRNKSSKLHKIINADDSLLGAGGRAVWRLFQLHSRFRVTWDVFCFIFTVVYSFELSYTAAFIAEDAESSWVWLAADELMSIFFIADLVFRGCFFPFLRDGVVVSDKSEIFSHYRSKGMLLDFVSCLPLELVGYARGDASALSFARILHVLRVRKLPNYFSDLEHYLSLWGIRISKALMVLLKMMFYYILLNHWCACIWFIIHRYFERGLEFTWATTDCPGGHDYGEAGCLAVWDPETGLHNVCNAASMWHCYVRSFYVVITTISSIGYGDISPVTNIETLWQNVVVLTGACIFAGIIGAFGALLSHTDTSGSNSFVVKMQKLANYMICRDFPHDIRREMIQFHEHKWEHSRIQDERKALSILPFSLQMELSHEIMKRRGLDSIPIIRDCSTIMQLRLANAMVAQFCAPRTTIYRVGDIGWEVYFIGVGLVKIKLPKDDGSELDLEGKAASNRQTRKSQSLGNSLTAGNHFGESVLMGESGVRQETIQTEMFMSELYHISKSDFEKKIFAFLAPEGKKKLTMRLLNENGSNPHVFHSFDDDNDLDAAALKELQAVSMRESMDVSSSAASPYRRTSQVYRASNRWSKAANKLSITSRRSTVTIQHQYQAKPRITSFSEAALKKMDAKIATRNPGRANDPVADFRRIQSMAANGELQLGSDDEDDTTANEDTEDDASTIATDAASFQTTNVISRPPRLQSTIKQMISLLEEEYEASDPDLE